MTNKLLLISHDANRNGAPILLLNLVRVLKDAGYEVNVLVKNPEGSLQESFRSASGHYSTFYNNTPPSRLNRIFKAFAPGSPTNDIAPLLKDIDCVINNTLTNGDVLPLIRSQFKGRIYTYAHELEMGAKTFTTPAHLEATVANSDFFLVPSKAVSDFLVGTHHVSPGRVKPLNYFIPFNRKNDNVRAASKSFRIGGCGTADWRKGFDIFIQVAGNVMAHNPGLPVKFSWLGINKSSGEFARCTHDIKKMRLESVIELHGPTEHPETFFNDLDLFLLPSREDPYPLVVLEAAAYSVPTVCFKGSGGAAEFIGHDAGAAVAYLSVEAMAGAVVDYCNDRGRLQKEGIAAHEKLKGLHQDASFIVRQFKEAIDATL